MDLIVKPMLALLNGLETILGNYGWAIIALTILVRFALWPVSKSQMKSMKMMQELQPKMKQLQERHKADPQKLQAEMFKLYKDYKFNPLGGCLPMLVQLPLFLGLFWAVSSPQFMAVGDPIFLNFVHLKHTGIMSHAGSSNDGELSLNAKGNTGLFGIGNDKLAAGPVMTVYLKNGKVLEEQSVPNPHNALVFDPAEPRAGFPLKIATTYEKLNLPTGEGNVKAIELQVMNNATHEKESVQLKPVGKTNWLRSTMETVPGKTNFHMDVLILVVLFAVTMILSQKMMVTSQTTPTGNEQQQQMMKLLPWVFSVMMFIFPIPAGVVLYMVTNGFFQMFQTWMFQRATGPGKPDAPSQAVLDVKPEGT